MTTGNRLTESRAQTNYYVEIDHFLDVEELALLRREHLPNLLAINQRYTPHIDVEQQFPVTPIYVDFLRTRWRFDTADGRPDETVAESGLGYAFGLLLEHCSRLRWCIAKDGDGAFLSMGRLGDDPVTVSVPPFNYVSKRWMTENAEVFRHFFEQINPELIGFIRPTNWLLDA